NAGTRINTCQVTTPVFSHEVLRPDGFHGRELDEGELVGTGRTQIWTLKSRRAPRVHTTPISGVSRHVLNGLWVCGHCGYRMIGYTSNGQRFYRCGQYHTYGSHACGSNSVMESKMLACIIRKVQEVVLNPENLHKVREEMSRQADRGRRANRHEPLPF